MRFTYVVRLLIQKKNGGYTLSVSTGCSSSSSTRIPMKCTPVALDLVSGTRQHCQEVAAHLFQRNLTWMKNELGEDEYTAFFDLPPVTVL